jgi:hypothetical protein
MTWWNAWISSMPCFSFCLHAFQKPFILRVSQIKVSSFTSWKHIICPSFFSWFPPPHPPRIYYILQRNVTLYLILVYLIEPDIVLINIWAVCHKKYTKHKKCYICSSPYCKMVRWVKRYQRKDGRYYSLSREH